MTEFEQGHIAKQEGRFSDALTHARNILALRPHDDVAYGFMGSIYAQIGERDSALRAYREAKKYAPFDPRHHDDLLYYMHHFESISEHEIFEAHRDYGKLFDEKKIPSRMPRVSADKEIKVGYVSADLHEHATSFILEPILAEHDKTSFQIFLYSRGSLSDAFTERFKTHASIFKDMQTASTAQLREEIIQDEIDILIDMGGHTADNSLPIFAERAAPVQLSWFGYMDTTGVPAIDYRLTDLWRTPKSRQYFYTEKLLYLPNSYTFRPRREILPELTPLPALKNQYITFGSFSGSHKIHRGIIEAWAQILRAVLDSRLLIMVPPGEEYVAHIHEEFEKYGIEKSRILPRKNAPLELLLKYMGETDIALDPFPYTSGTTAYHALSMGVPSITLEGRTEYARNCSAIMREAHLPDWISNSQKNYIQLAIEKTKDTTTLSAIRQSTRCKLGTNTRELVLGLENIFRGVLASSRSSV